MCHKNRGPHVPITPTEGIAEAPANIRPIRALVSIVGSNLAQSLAGLSQAEKIEAKDKRPAEPKASKLRTRRDEHDTVVVQTETAEAVRGLKDNTQEETREDRQEHPQYTAGGSLSSGPSRRKLDVEG